VTCHFPRLNPRKSDATADERRLTPMNPYKPYRAVVQG
jgi:hypothetical protein